MKVSKKKIAFLKFSKRPSVVYPFRAYRILWIKDLEVAQVTVSDFIK